MLEFKNGQSGVKKITEQAFQYQINGKIILNKKDNDENDFFHIIIRAKTLGDLLKEYINKNKDTIQKLKNFAILCLKDNEIGNIIKYDNISISSGISKLGGNKKSFENRIVGIENRVAGIVNRVAGIENRVAGIENRVDGIERRIDNLEKDVSTIKDSIEAVNKNLEILAQTITGFKTK